MDVEDIAPGQNFAQKIDQTIGTCRTMLVVIGPKWLSILQERAKESQEDYVRHEIESALARKALVVPVLVGGATAVNLTGLPQSLADLPFHQAMELRDASFKDDCDRLAKSIGVSRAATPRYLLLALAGVAALAVLLVFLFSKSGIGSWPEQRQQKSAMNQLLATAQTQTKLGEYEAAYRSCTQAVKTAPLNRAALNRQTDAAMLWLENYSVLAREDQKAEDLAAPQLAELMAVLDAALSRTTGSEPRSADILAHIGWAHWLNQHIAEKEFGPAAERAFRQALSIQPSNVYANAMLGNWLLQTNGSLAEALQHFSTALATNRERPLVRTMQLGGMLYNDSKGVPSEAVKALNDMRKNNEPLEESYKHRFLTNNFNPVYTFEFLKPLLTAVPPEEAWQTYLWLDDAPVDPSETVYRQIRRDFFQASTLQFAGKKSEAIAVFTALQKTLKSQRGMDGRIADHVSEALARLK